MQKENPKNSEKGDETSIARGTYTMRVEAESAVAAGIQKKTYR